MARKKIVDETVVEAQEEVQEVQEIQEETASQAVNVPIQEIPATVDKLLKSYPNYSALYIDSKGGVFPQDTQPNLVKDAILYQNPYYKS